MRNTLSSRNITFGKIGTLPFEVSGSILFKENRHMLNLISVFDNKVEIKETYENDPPVKERSLIVIFEKNPVVIDIKRNCIKSSKVEDNYVLHEVDLAQMLENAFDYFVANRLDLTKESASRYMIIMNYDEKLRQFVLEFLPVKRS